MIQCQIDFPDTPLWLRHTFTNPEKILTAQHHTEIIPLLQQVEKLAQAGYWAIGMLAYEAAAAFDRA